MRFSPERLDPIFDPPKELSPWQPTTFNEWERQAQLSVFLPAWEEQANQERILRGRCAWMIFSLSAFQSLAGVALLIGIGLQVFVIEANLLKILFSGALTEIFGLFFILARYLFNQPLRYTMKMMGEDADALAAGARSKQTGRKVTRRASAQ
jgi:hypothetical protein